MSAFTPRRESFFDVLDWAARTMPSEGTPRSILGLRLATNTMLAPSSSPASTSPLIPAQMVLSLPDPSSILLAQRVKEKQMRERRKKEGRNGKKEVPEDEQPVSRGMGIHVGDLASEQLDLLEGVDVNVVTPLRLPFFAWISLCVWQRGRRGSRRCSRGRAGRGGEQPGHCWHPRGDHPAGDPAQHRLLQGGKEEKGEKEGGPET